MAAMKAGSLADQRAAMMVVEMAAKMVDMKADSLAE